MLSAGFSGRALVAGAFALLALPACVFGRGHGVSKDEAAAGYAGRLRTSVELSFAQGKWADARSACESVEEWRPDDCSAKYCVLVARSMELVDTMNDYLTPHAGLGLLGLGMEAPALHKALEKAIDAANVAIERRCEYDLPTVPFLLGSTEDPLVRGDVRGRWTVRDAHLLAALFGSIRYILDSAMTNRKIDPNAPPTAEPSPLFQSMKQHLLAEDALLFSEQADPAIPRGGWLDRNGNGKPDGPDELLVDIFEPGTNKRVFDFSTAEFANAPPLPKKGLVPTSALPPARCGYARFHFEDVASGSEVGGTDGMSFSPDGTKVALPLVIKGKSQIQLLDVVQKGKERARACLTCGQPGNNDGVRYRPGGDAILFVSDRDHPFALGNEGGGVGQELYVMRPDGSGVTRLTKSHTWATNYHANWSPDGKQIVWGRTEDRTWDVMVADFVSDASGMRLGTPKRIVHDTIWWETHGFSADGRRVIGTSSRAGFMSTDIYAIDVATGQMDRLTDDPSWDEHAHLSPDGRKLSWISGRFRPAGVVALNDGSVSALFDFLWIAPGIVFELLPPGGYATELTLMDADGSHVQRLTTDNQIAADNEWSADGTKIVFRQTDALHGLTGKIRILTFDDCQ